MKFINNFKERDEIKLQLDSIRNRKIPKITALMCAVFKHKYKVKKIFQGHDCSLEMRQCKFCGDKQATSHQF